MEKEINKESSGIAKMFDNIAHSYDSVNHILSFNIDKKWRKYLIERLPTTHSVKILDLATGTGDLAIMMAKHCKNGKIRAVDISEGMLDIGRKKSAKNRVEEKILFQKANGENMPFEDNTFDYCTISFGVRNFQNLDKVLIEVYRCLKPGGKLFILEFGRKPSSKIMRLLYKIYSSVWIPIVGGVVSKNRAAYKYLPKSIEKFIHWHDFVEKMKNIGYSAVRHKKLTNGIVIFYEGVKLK
ncbi:MAG: bifunctional demethylmenaquinone methyltransferase/2-methoxy-6-polyprenyl-1,4-benzoquinol methylase UbiE [Bacteroidales bacterium]|nr:bifunctional demethylmenaquinone methyltransferase/2-methoxy-6-polyprenyl-1,4-benzoquinol methylase UbiE [Bacteroidales bacterium]